MRYDFVPLFLFRFWIHIGIMIFVNLSVGIIGLPNVGKSTLFNALLKKQVALVANYPFATIEPNVGVVPVPDERLGKLAEIVVWSAGPATGVSQSLAFGTPSFASPALPPIVPAVVKFVDIAGLVKGASEGAGLGNKFLSHIREASVIAHVVRAFSDPNVIREGSKDPKSDYETIEAELMLADLETIEKSKGKSQKAKSQVKSQNELFSRIEESLNKGIPVRNLIFADEEKSIVDQMFLLSAKPEIIVLNVSEDQYNKESIPEISKEYARLLDLPGENFIVVCAKIEEELSVLSQEDQKSFLEDLGIEQSGLERLIKKAYETLGLISFLTAPSFAKPSEEQGAKWEVRAWTVRKGTNAQEAAGVIHTDFVKKFIRAEVVDCNDFIACKGWKKSREFGKARLEGKDYLVRDGDVIEFRIQNS